VQHTFSFTDQKWLMTLSSFFYFLFEKKNIYRYMELCPNIVCINIMHSPAEYIAGGLDAVRTVWDGPMGCYPNNGTPASWPEWTEGDLAPEDLVKFASGWAKQGATLIGGCCGIGPAHIQALAQHFGKAK